MSYQPKKKRTLGSFAVALIARTCLFIVCVTLFGVGAGAIYYIIFVVPTKEASECRENAITRAAAEWKCASVAAKYIGGDVLVTGCSKTVVYQCTGVGSRLRGSTPRLPSEICDKDKD